MSYRSKSNKRGVRLTWAFFIAVVAGIFFIVNALSGAVFTSFVQVLWAKNSTTSFFATTFSDKESLIQENQRLREELELRSLDSLVANAQQKWYESLQGELSSSEGEAVEVLAVPPQTAYDKIIINGGTERGIAPNQLVVKGGEYVLGYVDYASERFARVVLFSSSGLDYEAQIEGYRFGVEGVGGGVARAQLRRDFEDYDNAVVRVVGTGGRIVGTVESTELNPQDSFRQAYINIPFSISQLSVVTVIEEEYNQNELQVIIEEGEDE